ncbi:unnamed protein product [Rotaria sp. Silwood2]|nr:unnamed protein product [Rotaria sp. Silwood2]
MNYTIGEYPTAVQVGDIDRDGILDVAVACEAGVLSILIGYGGGLFKHVVNYNSASSGLTFIIAADIDSDTDLDIVAASAAGSNIQIFYGNGNGTFQNAFIVYTIPQPSYIYNMISGYFNNDTLLDFAVVSSNTSNQSVAVFLGATGGNLTIPPVYYSTRPSVSSRSICAADVDRDGHVDLVVANYDLNTLSIFKGDGRGVFQTTANTVTLGSAQGPNSIVTADFNGDNIPDLAVSFQTSQSVMMLLGNGGGSFTSKSIVPTNAISSSSPRYLYAADLNHDGRPDITLGDFGANRVGIFLTQCLATTTSMTTGISY